MIWSQHNLFHSKWSLYEKVRACCPFCQTSKILWLKCWPCIRTTQSTKIIFQGIFLRISLEYSHRWLNKVATSVSMWMVNDMGWTNERLTCGKPGGCHVPSQRSINSILVGQGIKAANPSTQDQRSTAMPHIVLLNIQRAHVLFKV